MLLTGRYSLMSGEMKYQIPIIPLKTFNIQNGSYVEWTGNIMNPQLNITATERVRASVGEDGKTSRIVGFDVGIALSQSLENLGLAFYPFGSRGCVCARPAECHVGGGTGKTGCHHAGDRNVYG